MKTIKFDNKGTFAAAHAAEQWLRDRGFSVGPSQCDGPQAVWHGECSVSKWRNLSAKERSEAHAVLHGDGREGPMTIILRSCASPDAVAAFDLTDEQVNKLKAPA